MRELEILRGRAQQPQGLDHAQADAAAAVHREPGRLVDDQNPRVLMDDPVGQPIGFSWRPERPGL
jgi:hypothetical protein